MRALVTGGTGFVGANLVRRLLAEGREVALLVRPERDPWRLADVAGELRWLEAALEDGDGVRRAVAGFGPAGVFHCAAHGAYSWQRDTERIFETNVMGTVHLYEAARAAGVRAFVSAGSSSEYGFKDHPPREDEPLEPNSDYAAAKAAAALFLAQAARAGGPPAVTLRLYSVYGAWEDPRRLIPNLVLHALEGELPPLASPETARDYVFAADVCDAFLAAESRAAEVSGEVFNIGTGRQTTLREIVEASRRLFGVEQAARWGSMESRSWDTSVWVADPSRARERLAWAARTPLEEGLRQTADWFRSQPDLRARYISARA